MTNTMTYKGYAARIDYDDEDAIFTGRVAGLRDGVGFHADTVEGLRAAFHEAVEDYVETCARIGKEPQKTYSGQVMFRVSPDVHRKAAMAAELSGKSLNQWAEEVLGRAAGYSRQTSQPLSAISCQPTLRCSQRDVSVFCRCSQRDTFFQMRPKNRKPVHRILSQRSGQFCEG